METTRALHTTFRGRAGVVLGVALAAAALSAEPASAKTHTFSATVPDVAGDAATTGVDITSVSARYKTDGSLKVSVTTAGRIDVQANDAALGVWFGDKACKKYIVSVGGIFSTPGSGVGYLQLTMSSHGTPHAGKDALGATTYSVTVKNKAFKNLKVGCFWSQLLNPTDGAILDETYATTLTKK
jgi:hypothetical protein